MHKKTYTLLKTTCSAPVRFGASNYCRTRKEEDRVPCDIDCYYADEVEVVDFTDVMASVKYLFDIPLVAKFLDWFVATFGKEESNGEN